MRITRNIWDDVCHCQPSQCVSAARWSTLAALCARNIPMHSASQSVLSRRTEWIEAPIISWGLVACARVYHGGVSRRVDGKPSTGAGWRKMSGLLKLSASLLPRSLPGSATLVRTGARVRNSNNRGCRAA